MPSSIDSPLRRGNFLPLLLLLVGLTAITVAYLPGIPGGYHFDDAVSLDGLTDVNSRHAATDFVLSGRAGPLGRPLALTSFLPQATYWPDTPDAFRLVNLGIHLFNVLLLSLLGGQLLRLHGQSSRQAWIGGCAAAVLWGALPLLASTNLLIIQRMTSLSAMFTLLGLLGFFHGYQRASLFPTRGSILALLCLGTGGGLAMLCKENGALAPAFALAGLIIVRRHPPAAWRRLILTLLGLPLAAIAGYLIYKGLQPTPAIRNFTTVERLMTQVVVLWEYLGHAFLPRPSLLGPFHDDHGVTRSLLDRHFLIAFSAWVGVAFALLLWRPARPYLGLGVAWFLGGHLLESTSLPLELYFEHRNYLPLAGITLAAAAAATHLNTEQRRLSFGLGTAYFVLLVLLLASTTQLWGKPRLAAEIWSAERPASVRANLYAADIYFRHGDLFTADRILERTNRLAGPDAGLILQRIQVACERGDERTVSQLLQQRPALRQAAFNTAALQTLNTLADLARNEQCPGMLRADVLALAEPLLLNRKFGGPRSRASIHLTRARLLTHPDQSPQILRELETAWQLDPLVEIAVLRIIAYRNANQDCAAQAFLRSTISNPPDWPWHRRADYLEALKRLSRSFDAGVC